MADTYPTNDDYAKETLKSDGGPGDLVARTKSMGVTALSKNKRFPKKDIENMGKLLPDTSRSKASKKGPR